MNSIIKGKDEIIKIAKRIASEMKIETDNISESDRFPEIFIRAVREYDKKQREAERRENEEI